MGINNHGHQVNCGPLPFPLFASNRAAGGVMKFPVSVIGDSAMHMHGEDRSSDSVWLLWAGKITDLYGGKTSGGEEIIWNLISIHLTEHVESWTDDRPTQA